MLCISYMNYGRDNRSSESSIRQNPLFCHCCQFTISFLTWRVHPLLINRQDFLKCFDLMYPVDIYNGQVFQIWYFCYGGIYFRLLPLEAISRSECRLVSVLNFYNIRRLHGIRYSVLICKTKDDFRKFFLMRYSMKRTMRKCGTCCHKTPRLNWNTGIMVYADFKMYPRNTDNITQAFEKTRLSGSLSTD